MSRNPDADEGHHKGMNFVQFAESHGLLIRRLMPSEKVQRCQTVTKPSHKNGAYWFDGRSGWVWNWENGQESAAWWNDPNAKPPSAEDQRKINRRKAEIARAIAAKQAAAVERTREAMRCAVNGEHGYLKAKSRGKAHALAKVKVPVLDERIAIIPMWDYITGELLGMQKIWLKDNAWTKEFEPGTRASMACHRIGRGAIEIGCEGYATGLSIHEAIKSGSLDAHVVVCFNADNLLKIAKVGKMHCLFADNDRLADSHAKLGFTEGVGQRVAKQARIPFAISPLQGEDANDMHARVGTFGLQCVIARLMADVTY